MVTFIFWILDMPTHLIFGREIKGKVELRPGHLAREHPGEAWRFNDTKNGGFRWFECGKMVV